MRLYRVLPPAEKGGKELLEPTDEMFKRTSDFYVHVKKHGDKYAGHKWKVVSESQTISVSEKTQYDIAFD